MEAKVGFYDEVRSELRLRNYSNKTIKSYTSCLRSFVKYFSPKHPRDITEENVRGYLLHLITKEKLAASSVNQVFNALRFLYVELYDKPFVIGKLPRPQKEKKLPDVLNEDEVLRIFKAVGNLKHRTMFMLAYASGLRVSELVRLRIEDIDGNRGLIHIRNAKGIKDRFTVFTEDTNDKHLSARSIQAVLARAVQASRITKRVSMHTLGHSFIRPWN
jgi:integrase/recombinase XerD